MHIDIDFTLGMAELIVAGRIALALVAFAFMMTLAIAFIGAANDAANMRPTVRKSFPTRGERAIEASLALAAAMCGTSNLLLVPWILGLL